MKQTLAIMRTHKINYAIVSEFEKMQNCGVDTLLLINNSYGAVEDDKQTKVQDREFFGVKVKCLIIYYEDLLSLGLYNLEHVAHNFWFNVHYLTFFAKKFFKGYDFYWNFDYDAFLNASDYKYFFDFYKKDDADFIVSHFRKESFNSPWFLSKDVQWAYDDDVLHGSLYSIERYSARFLEHLFETTKKLSKKFLNYDGIKQWLHPEVLAATEAFKCGFKIRNFTDDGHVVTIPPYYIDLNDRFFLKPDNKMYHPCKPDIVQDLLEKQELKDTQINTLKQEKENIKKDLEQKHNSYLLSQENREKSLKLLNLEQDLINKKLNTKKLYKELNIKEDVFIPRINLIQVNSAKERIHNHLAYKLGLALIENSKSIKGYIRMPYVLSYIKDKHKKEQRIYNEKIKTNSSLKLPELESYPDYEEALKEKQCITYKLGEALIENMKRGGGIEIYKIYERCA